MRHWTRSELQDVTINTLEEIQQTLEHADIGDDQQLLSAWVACHIPKYLWSRSTKLVTTAVVKLALEAMANSTTEIDCTSAIAMGEIRHQTLHAMINQALHLLENPDPCPRPMPGYDNITCGNDILPGHVYCTACEWHQQLADLAGIKSQYVITGYTGNSGTITPVPESRQTTTTHTDALSRADSMIGTYQGAPRSRIGAALIEWTTYHGTTYRRAADGRSTRIELPEGSGHQWITEG